MHSPLTTGISFALLLAVVGGSFVYVTGNPIEIRGDPWFGFRGSPLSPALAEAAGLDRDQGFLVMIVEEDSPAEAAGLRGGDRVVQVEGRELIVGGDLIIDINGDPVTGEEEIRRVLDESEIGDTVSLVVLRAGETVRISVVLGEEPA
ncbi:MAG TPA: PDZ domain-containing protein [Nitrososphaera sp.]|nr:PDZ domain-containing protein [Nitrososphaera sp.]